MTYEFEGKEQKLLNMKCFPETVSFILRFSEMFSAGSVIPTMITRVEEAGKYRDLAIFT